MYVCMCSVSSRAPLLCCLSQRSLVLWAPMLVFLIMPATQCWVMLQLVSLLVLILTGVLSSVTLIAFVTDIASLCHFYYTYTCLHVVVVSEVATVYKPVMFAQIVGLLFFSRVLLNFIAIVTPAVLEEQVVFRGLVAGKLTYDAISSCWSSDILKLERKPAELFVDGLAVRALPNQLDEQQVCRQAVLISIY